MKKISILLAMVSMVLASNTWANPAAVMMMQKQRDEAKAKELRDEQYRLDSTSIPVRRDLRKEVATRLAEKFPSDAVLYRASQLDSVYDSSGECSRIIVNMFNIALLKGSEFKRLEAIFPFEAQGKMARCANPVTLKNILNKQQVELSIQNSKAPDNQTSTSPQSEAVN